MRCVRVLTGEYSHTPAGGHPPWATVAGFADAVSLVTTHLDVRRPGEQERATAWL